MEIKRVIIFQKSNLQKEKKEILKKIKIKDETLEITKETVDVIFTKSDGITPGNIDNIECGDIVIYGDYEYRYGMVPGDEERNDNLHKWWKYCGLNGWGVKVLDKSKSSYLPICTYIYGKPIKSLNVTFAHCLNLKKSPLIPKTVEYMMFTYDCCESLNETPILPDGVVDISSCFKETALVKPPNIPNSVMYMSYCFSFCKDLVEAPVLPDSVIDIRGCFESCVNLKKAYNIPVNVTDIDSVFYKCRSLSGEIVIDIAKLKCCCFTFKGTEEKIILTGKSKYLPLIAIYEDNISVKE